MTNFTVIEYLNSLNRSHSCCTLIIIYALQIQKNGELYGGLFKRFTLLLIFFSIPSNWFCLPLLVFHLTTTCRECFEVSIYAIHFFRCCIDGLITEQMYILCSLNRSVILVHTAHRHMNEIQLNIVQNEIDWIRRIFHFRLFIWINLNWDTKSIWAPRTQKLWKIPWSHTENQFYVMFCLTWAPKH